MKILENIFKTSLVFGLLTTSFSDLNALMFDNKNEIDRLNSEINKFEYNNKDIIKFYNEYKDIRKEVLIFFDKYIKGINTKKHQHSRNMKGFNELNHLFEKNNTLRTNLIKTGFKYTLNQEPISINKKEKYINLIIDIIAHVDRIQQNINQYFLQIYVNEVMPSDLIKATSKVLEHITTK